MQTAIFAVVIIIAGLAIAYCTNQSIEKLPAPERSAARCLQSMGLRNLAGCMDVCETEWQNQEQKQCKMHLVKEVRS